MAQIAIILVLVSSVLGGTWWHGHNTGWHERDAEVAAATAAKNAVIKKDNAADSDIVAKETEADEKAVAAFNKNATEIQSFALDKITADALNAFGGE